MKANNTSSRSRIGDAAAFRIFREYRRNSEGKLELTDVSKEEIYYLGVVSTVSVKGKALSIRFKDDFYSDQGGFNYFVAKEDLDYENFLKALNSQEKYKKWTLDEVRAFISPFLK